jgi:alpha-ribazole phosphatase
MKITFIRHTSLNIAPDVCYGQSDVDVSANFNKESKQLKKKLQKYEFTGLYSSPLQRCLKLAFDINRGNPIVDDRLKELNFGDWEMLTWDEIPRDIFDHWATDYANLAPPEGETFSELQSRGVAFVDDMKKKHQGEHIAVVSHGGMIRAILAHTLNIPLKSLFRFTVDHASITTFDFSHEIPKIKYVNL